MVWWNAMVTVHKAMGSLEDPSIRRVLVRMHGGLESGMVNVKCEGGGVGLWNGKNGGGGVAKGCEPRDDW